MTITAVHPSEAETIVASGAWLPAPLPTPAPTAGTVDLVSSARTLTGDTDGGVRWTQGFTVVGDSCGGMNAFDACLMGDEAEIGSTHTLKHYAFTPYLLQASYECSTFGATPQTMQDGARRVLNGAGASATIEEMLWNSDTWSMGPAGNPDFVHAPGAASLGAADPVRALANLEQAARVAAPGLGRYMIHASPLVVTLWAGANLLRKIGSTLVTYLDTVVVAGSGYRVDYAGPGGGDAPDGNQWAVVTGVVTVHLGDVMVEPEASLVVNRETNTIVANAVRFAAATWPPCLPPKGIQVILPTTV